MRLNRENAELLSSGEMTGSEGKLFLKRKGLWHILMYMPKMEDSHAATGEDFYE
jgi:hypothetical protein